MGYALLRQRQDRDKRRAEQMTPFEFGQAAQRRSGFFNKNLSGMAKEMYGAGSPEFAQFLDGLNAQTAAEVDAFYGGQGGYGQYYSPFAGGSGNTGYNPYSTINVNRYDHLGKKDNPADKLYADLIRAQTQDYMTRFAPVENFMAGQITSTGTKSLAGDLARTRGAVLGANTNVEGQQQRAMARMGLNYTPATQDNMGTVGALVGGLNDTRLRDSDRREAILSGSLGALSQKARGSVS